MGHAHQSTEGHQGLHRVAKGQLILKGLFGVLKGRIKPKVDWRAVDSPKKRANNLFCLLFCFSRQRKQMFVFWENLWRAQTAFGFI